MTAERKTFVKLILAAGLSALLPFVHATDFDIRLSAPGHACTVNESVVAHGGQPGAIYTITDWRGRPVCSGVWGADGNTVLPSLAEGYYHIRSGNSRATLAVVSNPSDRKFDPNSFYGIDSAQSWISGKGSFSCPWNDGDTYRTVSDLIRLSGIAHARDRLSWNEVNRQPDKLDFGRYMYNADLLQARGILVSGMFHDCPKWAGRLEKLPADLVATYNFCAQAAVAFGDRMGDWEFWNEEDIHFAPEPVWDYAAALKAAYLGFKSGRPAITVLPGALCMSPDGTYAQALFENDVAKFCDVFNYHTYNAPATYPKMFAALRKFMDRHGIGDHAIWMTESGTNLEGNSDSPGAKEGVMAHSPEQELVKAEFYPKSQIAFQMEGVARNYYFVFGAYNERKGVKDWGVMRRDGTVKPEYAAISTMARELADARLKGEMSAEEGVRAYLFERPDGSQTVAFWSVSPLDTARDGVVPPTPDFARQLSIPAADGSYGVSDLCGMRSTVSAKNGRLMLEATRFPAYVVGLHGLSATILARDPGKAKPYVAKVEEDLTVVIRVDLNTNDFGIAGQKTRAVLKNDTGRLRLQVWNLGDRAKTGHVEIAGGTFAGLPDTLSLGPRGTPPATLECVFTPSDGKTFHQDIVIAGVFDGKRSSRLVLPIHLEKRFLSSCEKMPLSCNDPKDWKRNTSADLFNVSWDESEQALRFDVEWKDQRKDRWLYPVYGLKLSAENLAGAKAVSFEIKSTQDKVENDFATANLMLIFGDTARPDVFIEYGAPIGSWEKRYVIIADSDSPEDVMAIRLGANPNGTKCTLWIRNIMVLKDCKSPRSFDQTPAAADMRPPFDKSDYKGTVAVQVNPWFPLDKPAADAYGGPNMPWIRFGGDAWRRGMELCAEYGVNAFVLEINEPAAWTSDWRRVLDAAARSENKELKVGMFFGFYSKTADDSIKSMKSILGGFREDLKSNPRVLRAGGHPVMLVYTPYKYKVEEWKRIFDALDAEFGRMVYLVNFRALATAPGGGSTGPEHFEQELRKFLPVFDGVSNYGSAGAESQRMCAETLKRVMKDYPGKIFEGGIHSTYTCHFHMGGLEVHLSREWRDSVDTYFASDPDSEMLTNLFDHYENSLVYPCYEREDFLLRYLEWVLHKRKGRKFRFQKEPEIVLTNHNMIQLGWESLDFEVMAFPIDSTSKEIEVKLELCNTAGEVLHTFEPRKMTLDDFRCDTYSVPSTLFANERGIVPRVKYTWQGKERLTDFNPMTLVSPSLRSYHMYWASSTRNRLNTQGGSEALSVNGVLHGGTLVSKGGQTVFTAHLANKGWVGPTQGYAFTTLKRDWSDFYRTADGRLRGEMQQVFDLPDPGAGLHYYHLEIENDMGRKAQTLPVWHTDGSRAGEVDLPVKKEDGSIATFKIEAARVPYWYYPCDADGGKFLLDASGYRHNGHVRGSGYGGGHLGHHGYNHYHNGAIEAPSDAFRTVWRSDGHGKGYLSFDGSNDYVIVMGGTAFPGASTYEMSVRPEELGREMGLFGSGNNQISVDVLADGRVRAARKGETEDVAGTSRKGVFVNREVASGAILEPGKWAKIQVTYDLRKLRLYVNGSFQGEVDASPIDDHEWLTHLIIGAKCSWVWNPKDNFKGDIRDIRIYGRNLAPSEFL